MAALVGAAVPNLHAVAEPSPAGESQLKIHSGWDVFVDGHPVESGVTLPHTPVALSWQKWQPASWEKVWMYKASLDISPGALRGRLFLQVERALANAVVTVNGTQVASHKGGFTPFECEITRAVRPGTNDVVIDVDSRWLNVPPSGSPKGFAAVDYYLPGCLGTVTCYQRPATALTDVWSRTKDVLSGRPTLEVFAELDATETTEGILVAQLRHLDNVVAAKRQPVRLAAGKQTVMVAIPSLQGIALWSPEEPNLYDLVVSFVKTGDQVHTRSTRIGFREAHFAIDGFYLNGKRTRLFGLNRHELFPYVGFAASPRAMRHDAAYLRDVLNCNVVRCSHYPQSTAFLDACDELGLMVWEEIPGWQYLGDAAWKEVAVRNVEEMVRRDRNHPSIIMWGTRVNESANAASDGSVGIDPALPGVPYMLAEAVGQFSYGTAKNFLRRYRHAGVPEEQNSQALLHAQAHDRAAQDERNAGVIAWCGFDYASPINAYEGLKCPGVVDTFRIPKLGASFYMAQIAPNKRVVLEPSFYWDAALHATTDKAAIFSNCEELHVFLNEVQIATLYPERKAYPKLAYPPFLVDLPWDEAERSILRIDGFVAGVQRVSRSFDGRHEQDQLWIAVDDTRIRADGVDSTRIAFGVSDRFGNTRPTAEGVIKVQHTGAGKIVGDLEFPLTESGAVGAIWLRGLERRTGYSMITVIHPSLGQRSVTVTTL